MNKTIKITIIMFLLMITIVVAQPGSYPLQENTVDKIAHIIYPHDEYYQKDTNFSFHIHFIKNTTQPANSTEFSCIGHFYDTQGNHILQIKSIDNNNGWDDYFEINTSLTKKLGTKPYNIVCNTSEEYAYIANQFIITLDSEGNEYRGTGLTNNMILWLIIFVIGLTIWWHWSKIAGAGMVFINGLMGVFISDTIFGYAVLLSTLIFLVITIVKTLTEDKDEG